MTSPALVAKPIVGYCDPWSVAPGRRINFMVSTSANHFTASLVRLRHGDPAPEGPGVKYREVPSEIDGTYPGIAQPLRLGSYAHVADSSGLELMNGLTIHAWVQPTVGATGAVQGIVTEWCQSTDTCPVGTGFGLVLETDGSVAFRLGDDTFATGVPLRVGEWAFVAATWHAETGRVTVMQSPISNLPDDPVASFVAAHGPSALTRRDADLVIGGHLIDERPAGTYDGKIDSPRIHARALSRQELEAIRDESADAPMDALVADWQFAQPLDLTVARDCSGSGLHATLINHPMQGVTGHNWTGSQTDFARVPHEYNALAFHTDDLEDASWQTSVTLTVPSDLASGIYALRVRCEAVDAADGAEDFVPFFVRPPAGTVSANVVFLAPTLSYLAYANEHSAAAVHSENADFDIEAQYQPEDLYAVAANISGLYDLHRDGSGHCYSSWRRPIVSLRPHYHLPVARSAHQLSADLHLVDWLEEKVIDFDVVTDHDLHYERAALLKPYDVLITGSHPEYWTEDMLNSLEEYLDGGGRLMYVGGNGFYWVTSISESRPHVIEVRRGRRGTASWRSEPGEDFHSTTGELGGLWRDRGRPPQRVGGVGMTAQGFGPGVGYERTEESYDDGVAWILDGVESPVFGKQGLVLGAAGGFEVDRMDTSLGTPINAVRLASSTGFSDDYQHVVEEVTTSDSKQGGTISPYVRADMVYYPRKNGSAVFATGSIAWCGALSANGYDNGVSRITENVLRRFADRTEPLG